MIRNRWYAILASGEVGRRRSVGVTRLGRRLVVWRDGAGQLGCVADRCVHRGAALSAGEVVGEHARCPFHGLEFDREGRCRAIPASGRATPIPDRFHTEAFALRESCGFVWLWFGEPADELPPLPMFEELADGWSHGQFVDAWAVHYSRAIENQLDVPHVPFVHRTTIGRSGNALVDGPGLAETDDELRFWVRLRDDDGTPPRRAEEFPESEAAVSLVFRAPQLWQNVISDKVRVFIAFVPVDEANSRLYLRFYHRITRIPGIAGLIAWLGTLFSIWILRQDKRVVHTQRPIATQLRMGEQLLPADRPIARFREMRHRLLGG